MLRGIMLATATSLCCLDMAFASPRLDTIYHPSLSKNSIYEGRAFLPLYSNKTSMLFSDIRTISDFEKMTEVNLGIGARKYLYNLNTVIGAYYFHDQRNELGTHHQNTIGGEILSKYFEARANLYMPYESNISSSASHTVGYSDNVPHIRTTHHKALQGYDVEAGLVMPTKYANVGLYGSIYNFYDSAKNNHLNGKKIRGEINIESLLPYNLLATIGAEYDYNDDHKKRNTNFNIRLGIPLSGKNNKSQSQDSRMTKSIVRDLHIRTAHTSVKVDDAKGAVKLANDSEIMLGKIFYVSNEEELSKALSTPLRDQNEEIAIVLEENVVALKDVGLKDNYYLISQPTEVTFTAIHNKNLTAYQSIGKYATLMHAASVKVEDEKGQMVELIPGISDDQVASATISKITGYSYDNADYDTLEVVKDSASLSAAIEKGKSIVLLDDDITLSNKLIAKNSTVVLGKGKVIARATNGAIADIVRSEKRKITDQNNDLWDKLGASFAQDGELIIDGIDLNLKSRIVLFKNGNLKIKNSTFNTSAASGYKAMVDYYDSSSSDMPNNISFENTVINKDFVSSDGILTGVEKGLTKFTMNLKDVEVSVKKSSEPHNLFYTPNVNIDGELKLKHHNNLQWDRNYKVNASSSKFTFNKGAKIIVESLDNKDDVTTYQVTDTVTLGQSDKLSLLYNKNVTFDLSSLSDKIVKVENNSGK